MASLRHFATSPLRHFATSPLRHASRLVTLIGLALAGATAHAALIINVEGTRGSGKTTWTLSGSSTATFRGTIRTSSARSFLTDDTTEFANNARFLSTSTTVGKNSVFAVTGSAQVTVGSQTRTITHIFLDPDGGASGDDFGIRVNSRLFYRAGQASRWSGRFTLDLDIGNFNPGTYRSGIFPIFDFVRTGDVTLTVKEIASVPEPPTTPEPASIPEPSSLALLGLALAGLRFSRKRKGATSRA